MRRIILTLIIWVAAIVSVAACFGNSGGGEQTVASIQQNPCPVTTSSGWQNEVYQFSRPTQFGFCPMVIRSGPRVLNGSGLIDVLMSRHGYPAGFVGSAKLWSVRLGAGRRDSLQASPDIPFVYNAPYVTPDGLHEQPVRGTFALTWNAGIVSGYGAQESDSLALEFPTNQAYTNGLFIAAAYIKTPVVISTNPGSITGSLSVNPTQNASWRVIPDWDTTGYHYQWAVDGVPVDGANDANFTRSFDHAGTYLLRVDQGLADNEVLSVSQQITVPLVAWATGNFSPTPYEMLNYTANASGGYAPLTYRWVWDGVDVGTDATVSVVAGDAFSSRLLELTVTDSHGNSGYANYSVFVPGPGGCEREPCDPPLYSRSAIGPKLMPMKTRIPRSGGAKSKR